MSKSSPSKADSLLNTIAQSAAPPSSVAAETPAQVKESRVREKRTKPARALREPKKTVHIYFHPADEQLMRELAAWFAAQGMRVSDSLVIRAALRAVERNQKLLNAYRDARQLDRRFKSRTEHLQS